MKQASFYKGAGYMILSAVGMSLVGLFGKLGTEEWAVPALMFWRYVCSSILLGLALLAFGDYREIFNFRLVKIQALRAFFVLLAQYCFFYYAKRNHLLNAVALLCTGPVFISLIEWGILRKKVGVSSWVAALIAFIGALFVLQPDARLFSLISLVGLLSGMSQGASQVLFGIQSEREVKPWIGVEQIFLLCALISLFPFLVDPKELESGGEWGRWEFFLIFFLAGASLINQLFRAEAYVHGTPSRLSPYLYFSVFFSGVWDWAVFGKTPNRFSLIGAGLIVLAGLLKGYLRNLILKGRASS